MPELTWPSPLVWLAIIAILATLTSLVLAWGAWDTKHILARMEAADRAYQETSQAMLARMDAQAEAGARDRTDRRDEGTEGQP